MSTFAVGDRAIALAGNRSTTESGLDEDGWDGYVQAGTVLQVVGQLDEDGDYPVIELDEVEEGKTDYDLWERWAFAPEFLEPIAVV